MSSFSSNLCDCMECQYRAAYAAYPYDSYGTCPFYPTMGQPYVYYAHMPQGPYTDRRKNPNCFVRAFRWYTQEHVQPTYQRQQRTDTATSAADPDVVGFANWLDAKYEQYLREGHRDPRQALTQTSEGMGVNAHTQSQPGGSKKNARLRLLSPWRKRGYYTNASEGGDVHMDANKSVVYLLEPKDLPRPISECCQVSSTPCCSTATVVKKPASSRSATNTCTRSDVEHIDPVFVQEGITLTPQQGPEPESKQNYPNKENSKNFLHNDPSSVGKHKSRSKSRIKNLFKSNKTGNVSCACVSLPPRPSVDAEVQHDTLIEYACECPPKPRVSENMPNVAMPLPAAPMSTVRHPPAHSCDATPKPTPAPEPPVRLSNAPAPPPVSPASVAHVELKPKQTWFQRGVLKVPKIFRQSDAECQCEPQPKFDKEQYCTQCGCRCAEMHEKLLCCECAKMSCAIEPALGQPMKQNAAPTPPPPPTEQWYIPEIPPQTSSVPPPPPPQTEPQVQVIPPQQTAPSQMLMSMSERLPPTNSEPYGKTQARDSFPCMTCNSAQTSDHAINLDQGIRGYPLFLKIVCADRLNDTCLCRQ